MPFKTTKNKDGTYKTVNEHSGRVIAKASTLENAKKQIKLIEMIDNNVPIKNKAKPRKSKTSKQ